MLMTNDVLCPEIKLLVSCLTFLQHLDNAPILETTALHIPFNNI